MPRPNLAAAKPLFLAQEAPVCAVSEALTSGRYNAACVVMPTGSGKTIVMRAIVAELLRTNRIAVACLVAPQDRLVDALAEHDVFRSVIAGDPSDPVQRQGQVIWPPLQAPIRSRRDIGGAGLHDARLLPRVEGSQLDDPRLWTGELLGPVFVVSRQLLCSDRGAAALAAQPKTTLERLGLICDEFQHHRKNDRNIAGRLVDWAMSQGCLVLGATATPFDEHGSVIRPSMFVHSTSVVQWALDPHSKVPTVWKVRRLFVGTVKDGDAIYEDQIGRQKSRARKGKQSAKRSTSPAILKSYAEAIAQDWLALGKPKAIANGPTREWNGALEAAFRAVDPAVRIASVIGDVVSPEVEAGLSRDANRKLTDAWDKVTYDVVISCCRFNEGRDWPPCSLFYNVGFPSSMALILQRFGRASRSKAYVKDYAQRSSIPASEQHMVFVTPEVLGDKARDKAWQNLRHCAGLAATYLCDYQEGLRWAAPDGPRTAGWAQSKRGQRMGLEAAGQSEPEVMKARAKLNAWLEGRRENPPTGKQIVQWLDTAAASLTADQRREVAANAVMQNPKLRALAEREAAKVSRAARAKRDPGAHGWVQADLRAVFDAVLDAGAEELVMPPRDWVELAAEFTAESATSLMARLAQSPRTPEEAVTSLKAWISTYGRLPKRTSTELSEKRQAQTLGWLCAKHERLLISHGIEHLSRFSVWEQRCLKIEEWIGTKGVEPRTTAKDQPERVLGRWLNALRSKHKSLLNRHPLIRQSARVPGLWSSRCEQILGWFKQHGDWPSLAADHGSNEKQLALWLCRLRSEHEEILREYPDIPKVADLSAVARRRKGKRQFDTLACITSLLAQNWRCTQKTAQIGTETGAAIEHALRNAANRPSASRGLASVPDRGQANSILQANTEIEADCWRFTLDGQTSPDPRPWADILASGDNKRIVAAERTHYLDWAKPGRDGKPVKRLWSAPVEVRAAA